MSDDPELLLFDQYDREYCSTSTSVARLVESLPATSDATEQARVCGQVQAKLAEIDACLKKMKMEKNGLSDAAKCRRCDLRLKEYETDVRALKARFETGKQSLQATARSQLMHGAAGRSNAAQVRGQMLQNDAALTRSTARLEEGRAAIHEAEEIGASILHTLGGQRETLERARDTLHGSDDRLTLARKHLTQMGRRLQANKIILYTVIVGMLVVVLYVFFSKVLSW